MIPGGLSAGDLSFEHPTVQNSATADHRPIVCLENIGTWGMVGTFSKHLM
jgi:hypothetical protein